MSGAHSDGHIKSPREEMSRSPPAPVPCLLFARKKTMSLHRRVVLMKKSKRAAVDIYSESTRELIAIIPPERLLIPTELYETTYTLFYIEYT